MPTFNRAGTIQRAVDSVLSQTFGDFELVIVDDGSSDNTIELLQNNADDRIRILELEGNQGAAAARNFGLLRSTGSIVCFLDSDDVWLCTFLERLVEVLNEHPEAGFAYSWLVNGPEWDLEGTDIYERVLRQGYLSSMITLAVRRQAILAIGGFDDSLRMCQDDDLCLRLCREYSCVLLRESLAVAIASRDSISRGALKAANGWERLYLKHKVDIISYCGSAVWAAKLFELSRLFLAAGRVRKGASYIIMGLRYAVVPSPGRLKVFRRGDIFRIVVSLASALGSGLRN